MNERLGNGPPPGWKPPAGWQSPGKPAERGPVPYPGGSPALGGRPASYRLPCWWPTEGSWHSNGVEPTILTLTGDHVHLLPAHRPAVEFAVPGAKIRELFGEVGIHVVTADRRKFDLHDNPGIETPDLTNAQLDLIAKAGYGAEDFASFIWKTRQVSAARTIAGTTDDPWDPSARWRITGYLSIDQRREALLALMVAAGARR